MAGASPGHDEIWFAQQYYFIGHRSNRAHNAASNAGAHAMENAKSEVRIPPKRKRGGQPGNTNRLRHGRYAADTLTRRGQVMGLTRLARHVLVRSEERPSASAAGSRGIPTGCGTAAMRRTR